MKNKEKRNNLIKITIVIIILTLSYYLVKNIDLEKIRTTISSYGNLAPLAYIISFTILPIFFFPVPILALVSGILFGVVKGSLYTIMGAFFNTTIMFYLGRVLGKKEIEKLLEKRGNKNLREKLKTENQKSLMGIFFLLRLIPLVSYNIINYLAGLTKIRYKSYILTTIIGIIPGTIAFLNTGDKSLNVKSKKFLLSIVILVAITLLSLGLLKIYMKKEKES